DWKGLTQAAFHLRDLLSAEGLECWPKLTGGLEVQVMVPVEPELRWIEAHRYSASIAEKLAAAAPSHYTTTAAPTGSHELYINFSYNRRGFTSVGAYSPRARP